MHFLCNVIFLYLMLATFYLYVKINYKNTTVLKAHFLLILLVAIYMVSYSIVLIQNYYSLI